MIRVELNKFELLQGAAVGVRRYVESVDGGFANHHGVTRENGWTMDIEAALAEQAYAKASNRYWEGSVNTFKQGDVGAIQVRHTRISSYSLIVREADSDDDYYVLVVGTAPQFSIIGGLAGRDAKQDVWLRAPNGRPPAWFVPQDALIQITPERYST